MTRFLLALSSLFITSCTSTSSRVAPQMMDKDIDQQAFVAPTGVTIGTLPLTDMKYVKGQEVLLSRIGVYNNTADLATLTRLNPMGWGDDDGEFQSDVDDDVAPSDHFSSCSLFNEATGAQVAGPMPFDIASQKLDFNNFAFDLPVGELQVLDVHCSLTLSNVVSGNRDAYALSLFSEGDLDIEDINNNAITDANLNVGGVGDPGVNNNLRHLVKVYEHGSFDCWSDGPKDDIILANTSNVWINSIVCRAQGEQIWLDSIGFSNRLDQVTWGDDNVASSVILYTDGYGVHYAQLAGGLVQFNGVGAVVPVATDFVMTVSIDTASIPLEASSGEQIRLNLDNVLGTLDAIGVDSGEAVTMDHNYALGKTQTLRSTKPTLTLAAGSPDGAATPGWQEAFRFNEAADSHGNVPTTSFTFALTVSTFGNWAECDQLGDPSKWNLYNIDDLSTSVVTQWEFFDGKGIPCASDPYNVGYVRLTIQETVAAGTTETYSLWMDSTGANPAMNDSLRIDLTNILPGYLSPIVWDDQTYATGLDGTHIKFLPIRGGTLQF